MREFRPYPLINPEKKFILFTNAKCGGTLLKSWFLHSINLENIFSNPVNALLNFKFKFVFDWFLHYNKFINGKQVIGSDKYLRQFVKDYRVMTEKLYTSSIYSPEWHRYAVVRDPYNRLVSAFVDKFCGADLKKKWVQKVITEVNSTDQHGNLQISFRQFVDYLENQDIDSVNPHWRRQTFVLENIKFDKIIDLKHLAAGLAELELKHGLAHKINFANRRQSNIYSKEKFQNMTFVGDLSNRQIINYMDKSGYYPAKGLFYDEQLKKSVRKIYHSDFEFIKNNL